MIIKKIIFTKRNVKNHHKVIMKGMIEHDVKYHKVTMRIGGGRGRGARIQNK